jgi:hypothetical protein
VRIPLRRVIETGEIMGTWLPFVMEKSESGGDVLLNIATMNAN